MPNIPKNIQNLPDGGFINKIASIMTSKTDSDKKDAKNKNNDDALIKMPKNPVKGEDVSPEEAAKAISDAQTEAEKASEAKAEQAISDFYNAHSLESVASEIRAKETDIAAFKEAITNGEYVHREIDEKTGNVTTTFKAKDGTEYKTFYNKETGRMEYRMVKDGVSYSAVRDDGETEFKNITVYDSSGEATTYAFDYDGDGIIDRYEISESSNGIRTDGAYQDTNGDGRIDENDRAYITASTDFARNDRGGIYSATVLHDEY